MQILTLEIPNSGKIPTFGLQGPSSDRFLLVPEASARVDDFNIVKGSDHFSITKPPDKSSRSFYKLTDLVHRLATSAQV